MKSSTNNNRKHLNDELYRDSSLGKHKLIHSSTKPIILERSTDTPSAKLSKLVLKRNKYNAKTSLISLASKPLHTANNSRKIEKETQEIKSNSYSNPSLITLASKSVHATNNSQTIKKEPESSADSNPSLISLASKPVHAANNSQKIKKETLEVKRSTDSNPSLITLASNTFHTANNSQTIKKETLEVKSSTDSNPSLISLASNTFHAANNSQKIKKEVKSSTDNNPSLISLTSNTFHTANNSQTIKKETFEVKSSTDNNSSLVSLASNTFHAANNSQTIKKETLEVKSNSYSNPSLISLTYKAVHVANNSQKIKKETLEVKSSTDSNPSLITLASNTFHAANNSQKIKKEPLEVKSNTDSNPSLITLASNTFHNANNSQMIKKETLEVKSSTDSNPSLISLGSNTFHGANNSQKIKKETLKVKRNTGSNPSLISRKTNHKINKKIKKENGIDIKSSHVESKRKFKVSLKDIKHNNVCIKPDIKDILKHSYQARLTKRTDVNKTRNVELCNDVSEWSMTGNDSFSHHLKPLHVVDANNGTTNTDITTNKIVEPMVNRCHGNVDLSWENPVIGPSNKSGIASVVATDNKLQKWDKVYSSCSFTRDMLKTIEVIGPVDNKFIACLLRLNEREEMLVLVDQHAAHERIRLEKLLNQVGYYSPNEKKNKINNESTRLLPPANISVYESELSMMVHYKKEFNNVGLNFSFVRSTNSSFHRVFVSSVPAIFVNGYELQLEAKGSIVNTEFLKEFIREQLKYMQSTGCPCNMSSRTIFKALASYACHGAIKFGDKISLSTCRNIMKDLATCDLPFQCAHGRPTIVPTFKLSFLDGILKKSLGKPNLAKLKY